MSDKEGTESHDDSELEQDTPLFIDYETAVAAQNKAPLDFMASNIAFLAGCLCYNITSMAR